MQHVPRAAAIAVSASSCSCCCFCTPSYCDTLDAAEERNTINTAANTLSQLLAAGSFYWLQPEPFGSRHSAVGLNVSMHIMWGILNP
jgi:hypothetical protein